MPNPQAILGIVVFVVILAFALISFVRSSRLLVLWAQAKLANIPINLLQIVEMRFRKCDPRTVIQTLILAKQAGIDLPSTEVQAAYLCGADLQKIPAALVKAKAEGLEVSFRDLVETDLRDNGAEDGNWSFQEVLDRIRANDQATHSGRE
jgi:uncharacterized protein YqfA (UPF0365 family)